MKILVVLPVHHTDKAYPCMGRGWALPFGAAETAGECPCHCEELPQVLHAGAPLIYHRGIGGSGIQPGLPCRVGSSHSITGVRVVIRWGVYPKALDNVEWKWLEGRMSAVECVTIGECGLDETGSNWLPGSNLHTSNWLISWEKH